MGSTWLLGVVCAVCVLAGAGVGAEVKPTFYVATDGNDAWTGRSPKPIPGEQGGPFRTLERARTAVRNLKAAGKAPAGGLVVELQGGVYERSQPFELTAEDSGTADAPITWRAQPGRSVRLVGGRVVTGWQPVTDPAVLAKLDPAARGHVLQADLKALGLSDYGQIKPGPSWAQSEPGLEVFFRDEPMTLARWPNEGFTKMVDVLGPTPVDVRGTKGTKEGIFTYEGDRPARWVGEPNLMLHGFWFWDWADQRLHVQSIDPEKKVITLDPQPVHPFGFRAGCWYYAYNLLSELDSPGEWYLDRERGLLYFWPPAPITGAPTLVSVLPTLLTCKGTSHLTVQGLTFEGTRGTMVSIAGGDHTRLVGCTLRNGGSWGATVSGTDNGLLGCDIAQMANGAVGLSGGDRKTLTPCRNYVENCHLHHFGRWNPILKPGVQLDGVGCRMAHNLVHDAPHMAVLFSGNDHLIEYNEIHSVVWQSNDAGVMYAGYNPAMRGHVIRYNYLHHIYGYQNRGCNGIYLDDMFCSATIYGNIFYKVPRAAFIGGGHDNVVDNNIFVDCTPALHVDARMMGWAKASVPIMKQRLEEVPYQQEPWRSRYPQLLTYLEGNYAEPRGNLVRRNICWGGRWDEIEGLAKPGVKLEDNLVGVDPKFEDAAKLDFRLKPDSPAWKLGFERIPIEQIGLRPGPERASWPVRHTVRPPYARPAPTFAVRRTSVKPAIDGVLRPEEWGGLAPAQAMPLAQGLEEEPVAPVSRAWLCHDGRTLYVAVDNEVKPDPPVKTGDTWGANDAVELAFRNLLADPKAPLLILRGYPSGHFASSDEAKAPAEAVRRAAEGVQYAAKVLGPTRWVAEWAIPLASLGIDLARAPKVGFSLAVHKTAGPPWVLWVGTHHATWNVDLAGYVELK